MDNSELKPSIETVQSFGVEGEVVHIQGGEGTSFRAGDLVFKPVTDVVETNWRADLMSSIVEDGFRVPRPARTLQGTWISQGWSAFHIVEGVETKDRAEEKVAVSRKFHTALRDVPKPEFIVHTNNPWAIADRKVWGEEKLMYSDELRPIMSRLEQLLEPLHLQSQLIHGDMTGNMLFHETLAPAIIDLSPYWRPAQYANAVIVVDSITWNGGGDALLELVPGPDGLQLILRAAMWRIQTIEEAFKQVGTGSLADVRSFEHLTDLLESKMI